jgi:cytosine/adenosine deaminase-related metal-dependent hydrolase
MLRTAHRADYVLVEPNRLLQNAAVLVSGKGRILGIEARQNCPADPDTEIADWGSAIILPGLINAHAHLELTSLHRQLTRFNCFTDWISQLISSRRDWTSEDFTVSAKAGAALSLASGTTLVGDITSSGVGWMATSGLNLRRVVFEEVLALSPDRADSALRQLNHLLNHSEPNSLQIHAISPHAPYSVSPQLYGRAAEMARNRGMLLATHLAETKAEIEFLENGTGEFVEFLKAVNVLPPGWLPPGLSPIRYLDKIGVLGPSSLLIHCNYLDEESIVRIKETQASVVYCPQSHAFFGHEEHPIRQLLNVGINVAIGTDSLASNSSLSMMDEMRFLFRKRKDLDSRDIIRASTINGARALNLGKVVGRLEPGYWADMAVLRLPSHIKPQTLLDEILEGAGECAATIVAGQISWQKQE